MWWAGVVFVAMVVWLQPMMGVTAVVVAGMGAAAAYWVDVQVHPWTRCLRCKGSPRRPDVAGTSWGDCRWCDGRGKRLRLFAREDS